MSEYEHHHHNEHHRLHHSEHHSHHRHHHKSEKEASDFGRYQRAKNFRKRLVSILFSVLVIVAIAIMAYVWWIYSAE